MVWLNFFPLSPLFYMRIWVISQLPKPRLKIWLNQMEDDVK